MDQVLIRCRAHLVQLPLCHSKPADVCTRYFSHAATPLNFFREKLAKNLGLRLDISCLVFAERPENEVQDIAMDYEMEI